MEISTFFIFIYVMSPRIEQLKEYARIIKDTPYAIKTYLQTYDNTQSKYVPFDLFPDQIQLINDYEQYNENITRKYRQAGVTTVTAAWVSKVIQTAKPEKPEKVLIVANKRDTAVEMANKIRAFLDQWPPWINVGFSQSKNSEQRFKMNNGCEVKAVATSKDALRGYTPTILIFDEAAYIEAGEDFWAASMASLSTGGKVILISCVTKDTYVFTPNGPCQLSTFINEKMPAHTGYITNDYSVLGKNKFRSSNIVVNNGIQKTLKIYTDNSILEGTKTHKLWGYSNKSQKYDWYQLKDLNVGDYVNINYGFEKWGKNDDINFQYIPSTNESNIFSPQKITPDIAYLIGLYISMGSIYRKFNNENKIIDCNITLTCDNELHKTIKNVGLSYSYHDDLYYTISSKSLYSFLEFLGFDLKLKATEKIIPNRLLEMSRENIIALLQGIFDSNIQFEKSGIGISLSSKKLIEQIRILLLNFGILTEYSGNFRLTCNSNYTKIFNEKIGFRFKRKEVNFNILKKYTDDYKDSLDIIPNSSEIIKNILLKNNIKRKDLDIKLKRIYDQFNKVESISRKSFSLFIDFLKNKNIEIDEYIFDKIFFENSKWIKIKKIEESENETFDFSLYNDNNDIWCHSIFYNGLLGHQTPNGFDPIYYGIYEQAARGANNFKITELKWYNDPRYTKDLKWIKCKDIVHYMLNRDEYNDEEITLIETDKDKFEQLIHDGYKPYSTWFENMAKKFKYDKRKINQEIEAAFLGSGDNVVSAELIEKILKEDVCDPKEKYMMGQMWQWKEPILGHRYIMGVDVSRGDSEDYSSINIIDFDEREQVLEYIGKIPPDDLASVAYKWGIIYQAYIVVDITGGMGIATARKLQEMQYKNLYIDGINTQNVWEYDAKLMEKIPGISFNNKRTQIVAAFEEQIRNGFKVNSVRLANEMNTFVFINGKPDHMKGTHDDSIMSIAMAMFVGDICFTQLVRNDLQNKAMIDSWMLSERTYEPEKSFYSYGKAFDPFGVIDANTGRPIENPIFRNDRMKYTKQMYQEYSWLFSPKKK